MRRSSSRRSQVLTLRSSSSGWRPGRWRLHACAWPTTLPTTAIVSLRYVIECGASAESRGCRPLSTGIAFLHSRCSGSLLSAVCGSDRDAGRSAPPHRYLVSRTSAMRQMSWTAEAGRSQLRDRRPSNPANAFARRLAVKFAPQAKRMSGPKLLADAGPTKCRPGTDDSKWWSRTGAPPTTRSLARMRSSTKPSRDRSTR